MKIFTLRKIKLGTFHDIYKLLKKYLHAKRLRSIVSNYRITKKKNFLEFFGGYAKNKKNYWEMAPKIIKKYFDGIYELEKVVRGKTKNQISIAFLGELRKK